MFIIQITTAEDEKFFVAEKKGKLAATDKVCLETKLFRSEHEAEVFAINHLKLSEKIIGWDIKSTADPDLPGAVALSEPVYLIKVFSDTKGKKYHVGYLHYNTTTESYFSVLGKSVRVHGK